MFAGEMAFGVSRSGVNGGVRDYVYGVEENPEDFFDDGVEFFVPDAVGARMVDRAYETRWLGFFWWCWVTEIGEDNSSSAGEVGRWRIAKISVEESNDYVSCRKFAWTLFLFVKEHAEESWEEG